MAFVLDTSSVSKRIYDLDRGLELFEGGGMRSGDKFFAIIRHSQVVDRENKEVLGGIRIRTSKEAKEGPDGQNYFDIVVSVTKPGLPIAGYSWQESAAIVYEALCVLRSRGKSSTSGGIYRIRFDNWIMHHVGEFDYD